MLGRIWCNIASGDANGSDSGRQFGEFLQKLNMLLPYDPAIAHFVFTQCKLKFYIHTETCIWQFVDLFITAKT